MAGADDDRLDAALAALTDPGEDAGFRARVLAHVEPNAAATRSPWWNGQRTAAGVLAATILVALAIFAWRPAPSLERDAAAVPVVPTAAAGTIEPPASAVARPAYDTEAPSVTDAPAGRTAAARSLASSDALVRQVGMPDVALVEEPLPYGMERIRLEPVSIQQFALREVREDPALAALMPPDPVRVDPIDIDEIAPRR